MPDRPVTPISYILAAKQYVSAIERSGPAARVFTFVLDGRTPMPPPHPPAANTSKAQGKK